MSAEWVLTRIVNAREAFLEAVCSRCKLAKDRIQEEKGRKKMRFVGASPMKNVHSLIDNAATTRHSLLPVPLLLARQLRLRHDQTLDWRHHNGHKEEDREEVRQEIQESGAKESQEGCEESGPEEGEEGCEEEEWRQAQAQRGIHEADDTHCDARCSDRRFPHAAHRGYQETVGLHQEERSAGQQ